MDRLDTLVLLLLFSASLGLAGILSSLVATRFGAPLLLVFLLIGVAAGEDGLLGIPFADFEVTFLVGSAALALILFDGGFRTRARALGSVAGPALTLATLGVVVTAGVVAVAARLIFGLPFLEAFLLGSIVASTDAAAVFFLIRTGNIRLNPRVARTLEIESGANDPVAVFLVIALVTVLQRGGGVDLDLVGHLLLEVAGGLAVGLAGGWMLAFAVTRLATPAGLKPVLVAMGALVVFGLADLVHGSGFLAAYVAGLVVGNRVAVARAEVMGFLDALMWLAQIGMFVLLGLLATPHRLLEVAGPAVVVAVVLILLARPLAVVVCLVPFRFRPREQAYVAWVGLRGAVAIFLATVPVVAGVPNALVYFDVAFFVVLVSLLVQGWTVVPAAERLGLVLPGIDHEPHRIELDVPGQGAQELVGYLVGRDSRYLERPGLPAWARLVMVVRGGAVLLAPEAGAIRPGDLAYCLAPPAMTPQLDRLFATTERERHDEEAFFGEFVLDGTAEARAVESFYGLPIEEGEGELTLNQLFAANFGRHPVEGDEIVRGGVTLVARQVDGDVVVKVGLRIAGETGGAAE